MSDVMNFQPGDYRFIRGAFMYSAGVAALPGYRIERVRFSSSMTIEEGFRQAARIMENAGQPKTAFAACELRSPEPFTETGFVEFNKVYVQTLSRVQLSTTSQNVPRTRTAYLGKRGQAAGKAFPERAYASRARVP